MIKFLQIICKSIKMAYQDVLLHIKKGSYLLRNNFLLCQYIIYFVKLTDLIKIAQLKKLQNQNYHIFKIKMLGKMKTIIRKLDLFYSNQIIRYNGQGQYKTLTGGVFSIFIITILLYAFWNMIIGTMEKTTITFQMMTTRNQVPPAITIGTDQQSKFMIGIQLRSLNLQLTPKFFKNNQIFHLVAYQLLSINQTYGNYSFIPLEYCTKQNWKSIPYMYNNFETLKIQDWICFPKNLILDMQGKPTTERFSGFSFEVHPCKNSTYKNDCAPQEIIDQVHKNYTNFMVLVNMVNNIINPNSQDPVSNFVFTKSAVISKSYGTILWMDVSDFKIQTDTTVLPYQTIETKKGYLFEQITNTNLFVASNGLPLFRLAVKKSDKSIIYKRQVQKLSYVVSFVGGYIGIIILSLFSVKLYTQAALSINLGLDIFKDEIIANNQQNYSFNIFNYIKLIYYRLSQWLGKDLNWPQQKAVSLMQEEVQHQLDINQIISRIMQLQNIMTFILQIEIIQGMKYIKSITCQKAAQLRKMFSLSKVQNKKNKKTSKKQKYKQEVIHQIKKVQMVDNQLFSPSQLRQAPIKQLKKNINEKKYSAQVQHISEFNSMKQSRFKPTNKIVNQYGYQCKVQDNLKDKEMKQLQQTSKIQNLKKIQRLSRNSKVHRRFWDSIDNNLQKMIEDLNENSVLQKQKIESAQSQSIQ